MTNGTVDDDFNEPFVDVDEWRDSPVRHGYVSIDTEVTLEAIAHVPPETGAVVTVEWDLDGAGRFPVRSQIDASEDVVVEHRHTFDTPGTTSPRSASPPTATATPWRVTPVSRTSLAHASSCVEAAALLRRRRTSLRAQPESTNPS
jgi:hypothetical protein